MKRIVAVLLTAIILISCLPLTAVAAKTDTAQTAVGVEAKFRLLLEDLELKWYHDPDDYFYHELAQYPAKNPEWILLRAGLFQTDLPYEGFDYNYAVFGNKLIRANTHSAPFRLGYGVYDVKSGAFYDLIDAWDMNLNNLRDVWDGLAITDPYSRDDNGYETNMYVIGDADADGEVTILDATRIQRCIAELDENPWEDFAATGHDFIRGADIAGITDFDRDGDTTVMDATRIQRTIAELPSVIGYNLAWFYQDVTFSDTLYHEKYLVTDRSQLDPDYKDEKKMLDTYDDSFFNDHCLVGLNIPDTEAYDLKLTGVSLDTNGVLCIDLISKKREAIPAAPCHQCVCLELSNAFIDDIKDIKLNITAEEEPADIPIASVVNWKYPAAARPSDAEAAAQGYRMIDSESVFNGDYQASYGKNAVFDALTGERPYGSDVYYGYMAVIKTPAQFRYVFPERDASAYNEAFFKSNALIVLAHREGSYTNQIFLSHLAVKGDTLYSQMIFLDMRGEPMNNIFYDVQTVKLSDVKNVKQCALWDDPAYSRNYINSGDYTSGSAIPEKTDLPGSGYHKITAGSVERDVDYEYGGHFDNLKTATLVFNPYQYRYFVNDKAVPGGDEIMDDNAYLVFNFADKQNTARVNAVYSDGKTLDIFFRTEEKWSDNQIHRTRQSLRIKKSDITGIKEIRLYSGAPDTSLLYTAIPPVSQQTLIPENPWDQGYSKFYTWSIPMSAPSPYDYSAWSKFPCNIENGCVMLLRSRAELEKLLPGFDSDGKYDDTWFNNYAIIGMISSDDYGLGGYAEIGLVGKKDNALYLEASVKHPDYGNTEPTTDAGIIPVYTFLAVGRTYISGIKELRLWHGRANETGTVYAEMPRWNETPEMPDVPSASGYQELTATPITMSSPSWTDFHFDDTPLGNSNLDTGYVLVIRTRAGLEKYLPGFDKEKQYDDAFFKNYAIICALVQGNDFYSKAYLDNIAVKGNTLYASAGETIDQQYDEYGNPVSLPVAPVVHAFKKVKQSDVASVESVSCWTTPYPAYDTDINFYTVDDHCPDRGGLNTNDAAYHITQQSDVSATIDKLYIDTNGNPVARDGYHFKAEKYTQTDFNDYASLIGMRVYQGSSMATVTIDRVYRSAKNELTVDVSRLHESNTESPDENWRMIFLRIRNYGKKFNIKLNVRDKAVTTTMAADVVDYFSENHPHYSDYAATADIIDTAKAFSGIYTLGIDVPAFSDICGENSGRIGFIAVVSSVNQFNYLFPESHHFDEGIREKYNESFFKNKALAVLVYRTACYEEVDTLYYLGVVGNKLYGAMSITSPQSVSPMSVLRYDALEIKRSDVQDVTHTALWTKPFVDFRYEINTDGNAEITKYIGEKTNVSVPDTIDGKEVVAIGDKAFQLSKVESVTLPNTVMTIGEKAFASCTYLTSVTIPDSVTSIGSQAFYYCSALADIAMSKNVTSIGSYAFYACNSIESFAIPEGVTRINYATFSYCTGLKSITMSDNVTYIGEQAFYRCNALSSIRLSSSVQTIDISAFEKCISLKSLSIPRTCKTLGAKAAKDCTALESVYFASEYYPTYVGVVIPPVENESIGSSAFEGCTALKNIPLSETIRTIGSRAFFGCTALTSFDLPASVTAIGTDTFNGCERLITVTQMGDDLTVKTVGDYAFRGCAALKHIRFTDSLTSIGDAAFRGCTALGELTLEENLKTIGADAFLECTALKELTVPESVTTVKKGSLGYTVDDTNHYVKRTDFTIRGYTGSAAETYAKNNSIPFKPVYRFGSAIFTTDDLESADDFRYLIYTDKESGEKQVLIFRYEGTAADLTIPLTIEGYPVKGVFDNAFSQNTTLRKVTFPYTGHLSLGNSVFKDCTALETVNMEYGVFSMGENVFRGCTQLKAVNYSLNLSEIPAYTFYQCKKLESFRIPGPIRLIGLSAFQECSSLSTVKNDSGIIEGIGDNAFADCPQLKSFVITGKETAIGVYAFGFHNDARVDGFTLYGYTGSTADIYAANMGVTFKSIDNAGPIQYTTEDIRALPEECGAFGDDTKAIYCTSADELTAALDTLYNGKRDQDNYTYKPEGYSAEWFNNHDVVAIRTGLNDSTHELYITYVGLDYYNNMPIDVEKIGRGYVSDENTVWCIALVSFDKLGFVPEIELYVDYLPEIEPLKPIIYLYPEEETELTVTVGKPGDLTCTYPDYGDGWHVTAKPDGTLTDDSGRSYYALYWEGKTAAKCDTSEGFVVRGEDTAKFFEEKLAALGLTEREAQEFIVYWLPQMQNNKYNFIRFATMEEIEEIMPLNFSVQPDTLIRILMEYKPLDEEIEVRPQTLTAPERKGFTAVEWGGCLIQ